MKDGGGNSTACELGKVMLGKETSPGAELLSTAVGLHGQEKGNAWCQNDPGCFSDLSHHQAPLLKSRSPAASALCGPGTLLHPSLGPSEGKQGVSHMNFKE